MTMTYSRSKVHIYILHNHRGPNFHVSLCDEPFLSYALFLGKVHQVTSNDFDMFKVTNTNMHATYTHKTQIFIRFALRWAIFELWPNLVKNAQNDLKMTLSQNTNMHAT